MQEFFKTSFPKVFHTPAFPPSLSVFVVWFNFCILPQAVTLVHLAFSDFKECSPLSLIYFCFLREFWVRQNKDRPLSLVLQGIHRHVKTNNIIPWEQYFPPSGPGTYMGNTDWGLHILLSCSKHLTNFQSFSKIDWQYFYQDFWYFCGRTSPGLLPLPSSLMSSYSELGNILPSLIFWVELALSPSWMFGRIQ